MMPCFQRVIRFWQITVYTFKCVPRRYVKPGFYVVHSSTDIIIFPKSVSVEQELPGKLFPSQTGRPFPVRNLTQVTFYTEVEFLRYLYTTELNRFVEFFATSSVRADDSRIGKNMHYCVYGSLLKINDYADRFQRLIQSF
jgi:hypothetical protein